MDSTVMSRFWSANSQMATNYLQSDHTSLWFESLIQQLPAIAFDFSLWEHCHEKLSYVRLFVAQTDHGWSP
jgi:hypothetical protein